MRSTYSISYHMQECQDSTAVITGGTDGIGRAIADALAYCGMKLLIISRNQDKGNRVVKEIKNTSGNNEIYYFCSNLSLLKDVKKVASEILGKFPKIDILINNAGIFSSKRQVTAEGLELNFALNYLSPFLLSHLLLSGLKQSPQARIINISSVDHFFGRIKFRDLQSTHYPFGFRAYGQSKLALIMFTKRLARKLRGTSITVNSIHPGIVRTTLTTKIAGFEQWFTTQLTKFRGISVQQAAKNIINVAISPKFAKLSGKYISKQKVRLSSLRSYYTSTMNKLWKISEKYCGIQTEKYI